jgi:hypothetical protein
MWAIWDFASVGMGSPWAFLSAIHASISSFVGVVVALKIRLVHRLKKHGVTHDRTSERVL